MAMEVTEENRPEIFGDFQLLEEIGRGGMGVIRKARQISLGRIVAIKLLKSQDAANERDQERLRAEASAAALLEHPNIVRIYEVGEVRGQLHIAMEFVDGMDLDRVTRLKNWSASQIARCMASVCEEVQTVHERGVLHRDLKPANIGMDSAGRHM